LPERFDGDGGVFAVEAIENFGEQFFRRRWPERLRVRIELRRCAGPWVRLSKPLANISSAIFSKMTIWRGESSRMTRHEHALRFDIAGTAAARCCSKRNAFMGDVLVDNPEPSPLTATMKLELTWPSGFKSRI